MEIARIARFSDQGGCLKGMAYAALPFSNDLSAL